MDKQVAIRRVRIAVSMFFAVLTVALCVLWVRSYWIGYEVIARFVDMPFSSIRYFGYQMASICCSGGELSLSAESGQGGWSGPPADAGIYVFPYEFDPDIDSDTQLPTVLGIPGFYFDFDEVIGDFLICTPMWFIVALTTGFSAAAWFFPAAALSRRFSLRTFLIATTLIAVVLGLGVWLAT